MSTMTTLKNTMKHSDFIKYLIEDYNIKKDQYDAIERNNSKKVAQESITLFNENVLDYKLKRDEAYRRYNTFIDETASLFLTEAIYNIFSESVPAQYKKEENSEAFMRNIVTDYVNEAGVYNLLNKMRYKSAYLSNLHTYITEAVEETKKNNELDPTNDKKDYNIPEDTVEDFLDKLDYNKDELVGEISKKVEDAIEDFIKENIKDHSKIKAITQATADKIDKERKKAEKEDKSEEEQEGIEESYNILAKNQINKIRNRPRSVFESMVINLGESVIKNDDLKPFYTTEGKINMDKVVGKCAMFYTFLETVNSTNLETVDSEYINGYLNAMII